MRSKFQTLLCLCAALAALSFSGCGPAPQSPARPSGTNEAPASAVTTNAPARSRAQRLDALENELKSHEDYVTFGLDQIPLLKDHQVFGTPLWKFLASLIYIFLAFYVSKFLDYLTHFWLKKWTAKTKTPLDDLLLDVLHGPVKVVLFVVFLNIGLDVFDWGTLAQSYLSKGLILIVACSLTYVALKVIDLLVGVWRQRTAAGTDKVFDDQLFPVISKSLKIFSVIAAVLVTASNLQINITGALASLSVGALAVGLAAQDTLANLFGAIAVYMDKPFRIGDLIRLDSVEGTVESIGLRSTRVRSPDGHHVTIPNKTVGNATIVNITRRPNIKTEMNFSLTYDTPVEKLKRAVQILEDIYRNHPMTAELSIAFNKFADSALNIQVVHWWKGTDGKACLAGMQELNLAIKERFDAEGIHLAFPSQTIHLRQDPDRRPADLDPKPHESKSEPD